MRPPVGRGRESGRGEVAALGAYPVEKLLERVGELLDALALEGVGDVVDVDTGCSQIPCPVGSCGGESFGGCPSSFGRAAATNVLITLPNVVHWFCGTSWRTGGSERRKEMAATTSASLISLNGISSGIDACPSGRTP